MREQAVERRGRWTVARREEVFRDEFLRLVNDEVVRPDGKPGRYSTVEVKHGVAVLARDAGGRAVLAACIN